MTSVSALQTARFPEERVDALESKYSPHDGFKEVRLFGRLITILVCLLCVMPLLSHAQVAEQDSLALVALYNATNGPNWSNAWNLNDPVSSWYGVTVVETRVTELYLGENGLAGQLPSEMGDLTQLTWWELQRNQLTGPIPSEIGALTNLVHLRMGTNELSGEVPASLGNLVNLDYINLGGNQLTGSLPPELGNLAALTYFNVPGNQFEGSVPTSYYALSNLNFFNINYNNISELISFLEFPGLSFLGVIENQLDYCDIMQNLGAAFTFDYIPQDSLGTARDTTLVAGQSLTLTAPDACADGWQWFVDGSALDGQFTNTLTIPAVSVENEGSYTCSMFSEFVPGLTLVTQPVTVSVMDYEPVAATDSLALVALYNATDGPNWFIPWNLSNPVIVWHGVTVADGRVTELNLMENGLAGQLPPEIGDLAQLTTLRLGFNQLSGSIPPELGDLTSLVTLNLRENALTDSIPSAIGNLTNLTFLSFSQNDLTGSIPEEIGNLLNLGTLYLNENQLSGQLPPALFNLSNLGVLNLAWNGELSGPIPATISNLSQLWYLDLSGNQFEGSIPDEIGTLELLDTCYLWQNNLSGSIPSTFGNLPNLTRLSFAENELTGPIPSQLGNLPNLTQLFLNDNQLEGAVPSELSALTNLIFLYLYDNNLTDLPDLTPLINLQHLYVENNQFTFEDIELNLEIPGSVFFYSPQDSVGTAAVEEALPGETITLSVNVGGANNRYQWFRNGQAVTAVSPMPELILNDIDTADEGTFICHINNTIVTDLTLYSRPISVVIRQDDTQPSVLIDDVAAVEQANGRSQVVFTVVIDAFCGQDVTINYETVDGTAQAGLDFAATDGVLVFTPSREVQSATITVDLIEDTESEGPETFFVQLDSAANAEILDFEGQATILDDTNMPFLAINSVIVQESDAGQSEAVFEVLLTSQPSDEVTVSYETADGSANAGFDFAATDGVLVFTPSRSQTQSVVVPLLNDDLYESFETFSLNLSNATNATIADDSGLATILSDDIPGDVTRDNLLNQTDVATITSYILSGDGLDPIQFALADINQDGAVDVADQVLVIDRILSGCFE